MCIRDSIVTSHVLPFTEYTSLSVTYTDITVLVYTSGVGSGVGSFVDAGVDVVSIFTTGGCVEGTEVGLPVIAGAVAVSYTHLDVYKRQLFTVESSCSSPLAGRYSA